MHTAFNERSGHLKGRGENAFSLDKDHSSPWHQQENSETWLATLIFPLALPQISFPFLTTFNTGNFFVGKNGWLCGNLYSYL